MKEGNCRLLLFDLDGTLLRSDKIISQATLKALYGCREKGIQIGISTSRGERNALPFIEELQPDISITSAGALVKYNGETIYKAEFSKEQTRQMIAAAREICGADCEITVDTADAHYWNYRMDPRKQDPSWGDSIYTDFKDFEEGALKICVEIFEENQAMRLRERLEGCDCIRFSDGYWYKFTRKTATKERAIEKMCSVCRIRPEEITAFGDDLADIGMLKLCGTGIAMGNAVPELKKQADLIIAGNDEDGIAQYLAAAFGVL
ncbi:MAG: HAD family hydrolase [Provencibacterium sp.]|nr:HAD family hydrolase [Provencibacterium sp.]